MKGRGSDTMMLFLLPEAGDVGSTATKMESVYLPGRDGGAPGIRFDRVARCLYSVRSTDTRHLQRIEDWESHEKPRMDTS